MDTPTRYIKRSPALCGRVVGASAHGRVMSTDRPAPNWHRASRRRFPHDFPRHPHGKRAWWLDHHCAWHLSVAESLRSRHNKAVSMSNSQNVDRRKWRVRRLLPLLFGLIVVGAVIIQWWPPKRTWGSAWPWRINC